MEIRPYTHYCESEIVSLYRAVGWSNYCENPKMLCRAYENSLCILGAFEKDTLIGIIRAVGDDASVLLIQDLIVHPEFQRKGIGKTLVKALLERYAHVYQIQLMTDNTEKTKAFYNSCGFGTMREFGCCGFLKM